MKRIAQSPTLGGRWSWIHRDAGTWKIITGIKELHALIVSPSMNTDALSRYRLLERIGAGGMGEV